VSEEDNALFRLYSAAVASDAARRFELLLLRAALIERVVGAEHLDAGREALAAESAPDRDDDFIGVADREMAALSAEERKQLGDAAMAAVARAIRDATLALVSASEMLGADFEGVADEIDPTHVVLIAAGMRAVQGAVGRAEVHELDGRSAIDPRGGVTSETREDAA
jgi:hypothetical protein